MKLTAQLKLLPTPEQADALRRTLEAANAACDTISASAWATTTFRQFALHTLVYHDIREAFGLAAQLTVRCIAKVADAYKLDKDRQRTFAPLGSVAYDDRILAVYPASSTISIWTLDGRQVIPCVCGNRQRALLASQKGESDLAYRDGNWYLFATCDAAEAPQQPATEALGVDLGVTNIAVDSDGETHSGKAIKNVRYRHRRLRTKLQRKGTLGSRRRLRKLAGQERRFATWVNHNLSKKIVTKAERTKRAIALEDLTHIRTRIRARRSQRVTLHSWAFFQLRAFVVYKAALVGVAIHLVDSRNTSRTCPKCGCIAKANRKTQASFVCTRCGFAGHADVIAAGNISGRAPVNVPYCSEAGSPVAPEQSPRL
ncbi:MAG: IS200/IS605 family element transposase accessory protein TnpB [Chloroflexi bacterium]|nr:IS200/IS605 family element transposase accessory protein TnpB [Chloroflexota bacterium]